MSQASGKILLFGEHAVVYGIPAIAAAIPAGMRASAHHLEAGRASEIAFRCQRLMATSDEDSLLARAFAAMLDALALSDRPCRVELTSELPVGAGLGSSAAMAIATARALDELFDLSLDDPSLLRVAMASENEFHGNASGLDPAVALHGGLLHFRRASPPHIRRLECNTSLHLIVAQVEEGAHTRSMVERVAALRARYPDMVRPLLESLGAVVAEAETLLRKGDDEGLGRLLDFNHGLLASLGVSTSTLDSACHAARAAGAFGAKLTGAGGGGCMFALAPRERVDEVIDALQRDALHLLSFTLRPDMLRPDTLTVPQGG